MVWVEKHSQLQVEGKGNNKPAMLGNRLFNYCNLFKVKLLKVTQEFETLLINKVQ